MYSDRGERVRRMVRSKIGTGGSRKKFNRSHVREDQPVKSEKRKEVRKV